MYTVSFTRRQTSFVLLATAKPRIVLQIARQWSVIHHSREHFCTDLESTGYRTAHKSCHFGAWWCKTWKLLGHGNPFHEGHFRGVTHSVDVIPSRFHFVIMTLTADCGIFSNEEISQMDRWRPITVTCRNSLSSYECPIISQRFVEAVCMCRWLILYTCGCGSEWIQWFGWVSEHFWWYCVACGSLLTHWAEVALVISFVCVTQKRTVKTTFREVLNKWF